MIPCTSRATKKEIKKVWTEKLLPFLENSHAESGAKERFPQEIVKKWINEPIQPDGTSCGLMVLGMVYLFVHNAHRFKTSSYH
ncbi:hypothetical protein PPTG_22601 [Phytophthora nicotianae INRA-310]|uniref:Ubiquitin-like protease family profile domain-containing protein n=1 Tax=Phytophthora nicotianae (strain INRA-310) TaxID=761204 RepID=W2QFH6_PHYN3|nr:hypothetical protein PPTG_22601 [Phytophthora nicotianae INRA-310]ETN11626.1 hypothetical protein PPTG_22601 [Phytophthora nicotianae INRA-310]